MTVLTAVMLASVSTVAVASAIELRNESTELCLGIDQKWRLAWVAPTGQRARLVNVRSNLFLGITNASHEWNAKAVQWECNGNADQTWHF
ncbi:RICIN domain-containing protein [Streptomyces aureocirculatus]|uniref:RICIN domain-containing protein n=1 Tax=Streptomyces aureocirculatus TaxID=67275 RepID=UPI0004C4D8D2|nr:RICIN domain-containing protein [Streptomyces aureocirculatus]